MASGTAGKGQSRSRLSGGAISTVRGRGEHPAKSVKKIMIVKAGRIKGRLIQKHIFTLFIIECLLLQLRMYHPRGIGCFSADGKRRQLYPKIFAVFLSTPVGYQ